MMRQEDKRVGRSGISSQAELAAEGFRQADRLEQREALDTTDAIFKPVKARRAREDGERLFKPPKALVGDAATELVPAPQEDEHLEACRLSMITTLAEPNIISVDASEHRASLATRANVLSQALGFENVDLLLERMIHGSNRFNALVVIDELDEEHHRNWRPSCTGCSWQPWLVRSLRPCSGSSSSDWRWGPSSRPTSVRQPE